MIHTLIAGATLTGKTTLLKSIIDSRLRSGINCIAFDPVGDIEGGINDAGLFVETLSKSENATVIIDEAEYIFSRNQPENIWILSRGRHKGFECFVSAHRPQLINPSIRLHFTRFYCFRVHPIEQEMIEKSFACDLSDAQNLRQGEYVFGRYVEGSFLVDKGRIF